MTLLHVLGWFANATEEFDETQVSPGVWGFAVVAAIGVAVFFLGMNMVRRIRKVEYRAEIREQLQAEIDAAKVNEGNAEDPQHTSR